MITILDKHDCCGCGACVQRCPKLCIAFDEDEEGFLYPKVDEKVCIGCGICEKVCPVLNQNESKKPIQAYAAINQNEGIRAMSSSGGIFTAIAEKVIADGGVVFGAKFNDQWEVVHGFVDSIDGLDAFRGSKYVQSRIGNSYIQVEEFLNKGQIVLFSGTSCHIAGLNNFLRKPYENLITVDVVCHGVPSPKLWRDYLSTVVPLKDITNISMKDKTKSWRGYRITIKGKYRTISEKASTNKYMMAFSQNLSLRPSCFSCPAKAGKSKADITLADFWGIEKILPQMDDGKGTSFICANSKKGKVFIEQLTLQMQPVDYLCAIPYNSCIYKSSEEPKERQRFWKDYLERGVVALHFLKKRNPSIIKRILKLLFR